MKLLFKQRFFSWLDSYDIFDERGSTAYTVEGRLAWGHKLVISDPLGEEVGVVREQALAFLPRFTISVRGKEVGEICKEFTFFRPSFRLRGLDWKIRGNFMEWDYRITDGAGRTVAQVSKELFHWTDTYSMEIDREEDALYVLMIVLAIDAAKCSAGH